MKQVILFLAIFILLVEAAASYAASVKLGGMEVFPLIDTQGESPVSLLAGATEEQIARYVPSGMSQAENCKAKFWHFL